MNTAGPLLLNKGAWADERSASTVSGIGSTGTCSERSLVVSSEIVFGSHLCHRCDHIAHARFPARQLARINNRPSPRSPLDKIAQQPEPLPPILMLDHRRPRFICDLNHGSNPLSRFRQPTVIGRLSRSTSYCACWPPTFRDGRLAHPRGSIRRPGSTSCDSAHPV